MEAYSLFLGLHLGAGSIALLSFWTAAAFRKGSRPHVLAGRVYLLAMLGVILSGGPLVAMQAARGQAAAAAFLGFLLVLVSWSCWGAWRAIRDRRHPERYAGPVYQTLSWLTLAGGGAMAGLALTHGSVLFGVFAAVGVLAGLDGLRVRRRIAADPLWWLKEHYGAMLGNAVATHIAFLSIGLRRLLPGLEGPLLTYLSWFGPLAVALAAGWWIERRLLRGQPLRGRRLAA